RSILAFADSLIRQDTERRALVFVPTRPEGEPVTWERYPDPDIEALAVGEQILRLVRRGARDRGIAALYPTNAQSEAFARHFAALEIPFTSREDGDFYARKEIQGLLAYLHFFAGAGRQASGVRETTENLTSDAQRLTPYADEWLLALLNVPNRKLSRAVGAQL